VSSLAQALLGDSGMSSDRNRLGKRGEDLACDELERRGYVILDRRYRRCRGELDIVARDGATVVFVEVKTRDGRSFGAAAEAVTALKRRRIVQLAMAYLVEHRLSGSPCRFDVVAIQVDGGREAVQLYQNAFDAGGVWQ
jgi:putative endonuclease